MEATTHQEINELQLTRQRAYQLSSQTRMLPELRIKLQSYSNEEDHHDGR